MANRIELLLAMIAVILVLTLVQTLRGSQKRQQRLFVPPARAHLYPYLAAHTRNLTNLRSKRRDTQADRAQQTSAGL